MSSAVSSRIRAVVANTFGVPLAAITDTTTNSSIDTWDSMNHIHLIMALEAEFGVSFEPEEAIELTSIVAIEQAIAATTSR